jgi:ABC-2 type transport system ATP-binding protein
MTYTLDVRGLRKSYGDQVVLAGIDLQVGPGEVFALLGANGAGKTTAVRILSTLSRPDSGEVRIAGHDLATDPFAVKQAISLTGQYAAVDEVLTGRENLVMVARLRRLPRQDAARRADELLEQFKLVAAADRAVTTYSGGMRRRLDLAMSLVVPPTVLFLDEPTTGLDPRSRNELWAGIGDLAGSGVTVLLTTQYLDEADRLADRVAVLHNGTKVAEGTADELKSQVGGEMVAFTFMDTRDVATARAVLEREGRAVSLLHDDGTVLRVTGNGTAEDVRELLDLLAWYEVPASRLSLDRPTLDDVFLSLTALPGETTPRGEKAAA